MRLQKRFKFEHPTRPGAVFAYGVDHALPGAFFAELREGRRVIAFDGLSPGYDAYGATLEQTLHWLSEHGAYSREDLQDLLLIRERGERVPERLRLVAEVVANMLTAAD